MSPMPKPIRPRSSLRAAGCARSSSVLGCSIRYLSVHRAFHRRRSAAQPQESEVTANSSISAPLRTPVSFATSLPSPAQSSLLLRPSSWPTHRHEGHTVIADRVHKFPFTIPHESVHPRQSHGMLHSPLNPVSPHLHQHRHPGHSVPQYPTRCSELVISPGPMEPAAGPSPTAVSTNRVVQRRSQSPFTAHDPHSTQVMESDLDVMPSGLPAAAHLDEPPTSSQPMEASTSSHETHAGPSRGSSLDMDKMARPKRKRITPDQLETLLELFTQTDTPSYELRESVGNRLGMSNREVQVRDQVPCCCQRRDVPENASAGRG